MKIAFVDGIFAHWPSLTYGQRASAQTYMNSNAKPPFSLPDKPCIP